MNAYSDFNQPKFNVATKRSAIMSALAEHLSFEQLEEAMRLWDAEHSHKSAYQLQGFFRQVIAPDVLKQCRLTLMENVLNSLNNQVTATNEASDHLEVTTAANAQNKSQVKTSPTELVDNEVLSDALQLLLTYKWLVSQSIASLPKSKQADFLTDYIGQGKAVINDTHMRTHWLYWIQDNHDLTKTQICPYLRDLTHLVYTSLCVSIGPVAADEYWRLLMEKSSEHFKPAAVRELMI